MPRYTQQVLDYFQDPRNEGVIDDADIIGNASINGTAPVRLYFKIRDGVIKKVKFQAFGCGFLIACCSALTELLTDQKCEECQINTELLTNHLGGLPPDKEFCAVLAIAAMRDALTQFAVYKDSSK